MEQDRVSSKSTFSKPKPRPKINEMSSNMVGPDKLPGANPLSKQRQQIPMDRLIQQISSIVFSNVKIYLEDRLSFIDRLVNEAEDVKFNVTTLSSLLHKKNLFSEEEYKNLHAEVARSFGMVGPHGKMGGKVIVTKYNFPSER